MGSLTASIAAKGARLVRSAGLAPAALVALALLSPAAGAVVCGQDEAASRAEVSALEALSRTQAPRLAMNLAVLSHSPTGSMLMQQADAAGVRFLAVRAGSMPSGVAAGYVQPLGVVLLDAARSQVSIVLDAVHEAVHAVARARGGSAFPAPGQAAAALRAPAASVAAAVREEAAAFVATVLVAQELQHLGDAFVRSLSGDPVHGVLYRRLLAVDKGPQQRRRMQEIAVEHIRNDGSYERAYSDLWRRYAAACNQGAERFQPGQAAADLVSSIPRR